MLETLIRKKCARTLHKVPLTAAPRNIGWTLLRAKTKSSNSSTDTEDISDLEREEEVDPMASPTKLVQQRLPNTNISLMLLWILAWLFCAQSWLGAWIPITRVQYNDPLDTNYFQFINGCHDCALTKYDAIISIRKITVCSAEKGTNAMIQCTNACPVKMIMIMLCCLALSAIPYVCIIMIDSS